MRILLVEDELQLQEQLREILVGRHYAVDATGSGEEALFLGREIDFDLAVVDIGLPDRSGLEVVREWRREQRRFPVLFLTARGHWREKVEGLEAGGDDYLVKPFHVEELAARVQALIRRAAGQPSPVLVSGTICLDTAAQRVTRDGDPVELTAYEYRTLEYLMRHPEELISKSRLMDHLYPEEADRDPNVVEQFIARLRRKLSVADAPPFLATLRGQGYRFDWPVQAG